MKNGGIFWIASYPKSGNTWVRCLIASLKAGGASVDLKRMGNTVVHAADRVWLERYIDVASEDLCALELRALRTQAYREFAAQGGGPLKTHDCYDPRLMPPETTAGAVYIVRDPRDVAPSWADHLGVSVDTAIARMGERLIMSSRFDRWRPQVPQRFASWSENVASWLDQTEVPLLLLRYEALLSEPLDETRRLAEFLGLPTDLNAVTRSVEACGFQRLRDLEEREGFSERRREQRRFFRQGRAGAWRSTLQPEQTERLVAQHGEIMQRLGYALD